MRLEPVPFSLAIVTANGVSRALNRHELAALILIKSLSGAYELDSRQGRVVGIAVRDCLGFFSHAL